MSDIKKELDKKPAEVVARQLVTWIRDKGLERTLEILGGDSPASNTGWRGGIIFWIEKLLGRKLHSLICMALTNEGISYRRRMEKPTPKRDFLVFPASY